MPRSTENTKGVSNTHIVQTGDEQQWTGVSKNMTLEKNSSLASNVTTRKQPIN